MADNSAIDPYEIRLQSELDALNLKLLDPDRGLNVQISTEEKNIADFKKLWDGKRAVAEGQLLSWAVGAALGKGLLAEIAELREQLTELQRAKIFAQRNSIEAITGTTAPSLYARASYMENINLDNAIVDWANSLKSGEQAGFEKFIFGHVIKRQPPRIGKAEEYQHAFETADFQELAKIYSNEYLALEKELRNYEAGLSTIVGFSLKEAFFPTQPNLTTLDDLQADKVQVEKDISSKQYELNRFREIYPEFFRRWSEKPGMTEEEARDRARNDTQKAIAMEQEEKKKKEEQASTAVITEGERVAIPTQRAPVSPRSVPTEAPEKLTASQQQWERIKNREASWRVELINFPRTAGSRFFDWVKGSLFGRGTSQVAGQAAGQVAGQVVTKTAAQAVTKTVAKGALTRVVGGVAGAAAAPVGVALLLKEFLTNKDFRKQIKEMLQNLGSAAGIMVFKFIHLLMANLAVGMAGLAGAITGFILGFKAGAVMGAAIGSVVPFAGTAIGGLFGGLIGGGLGAAAGFLTAAGVGNAIFGSSGISIGAATVPTAAVPAFASSSLAAGGMTAGITAAGGGVFGIASSLWGTFFSIGGAAPVLVAVGGTAAVSLIAITTVASAMVVSSTAETKAAFKVEKVADVTSVPDYTGVEKTITYKIKITPTSDAVTIKSITDEIKNHKGSKVTNLKTLNLDPKKLEQEYTYTISGTQFKDSYLVNTVTVVAETTDAELKLLTQTAGVAIALGSPADQPPYTGACPIAPAGNACAVSELKNFGTNAANASRICFRETGGNGDSVNDGCRPNKITGEIRHNEYSVGIFQINLFAHDNYCIQVTGKNPFNKPLKLGKYPASDACDRDEDLLKQCADYWKQDVNNIKAAFNLSGGGKNWSAWSTSAPPSDRCVACCNLR